MYESSWFIGITIEVQIGTDAAMDYIADIRFLTILVNLTASYHFQKGKQVKS